MVSVVSILFVTVHIVHALSPSAKVFECDKIIMDIYNHPHESKADIFMETIQSYIKTVNSTTDQFKQSDKIFEDCKKLHLQSWPEFLLYGLQHEKTEQLQKKFRWNDEQVQKYKAIMKEAEYAWTGFLRYYYSYLEKKGWFSTTDRTQ